MFTTQFNLDSRQEAAVPKEGDLFKIIHSHDKTFEIRYGFYEERDRQGRYAEPMAIYPDFIKYPQYTEQGVPFATAIQIPCQYFYGNQDENSTCEDCNFYRPCEELLGLCTCPENQKALSPRKPYKKVEEPATGR